MGLDGGGGGERGLLARVGGLLDEALDVGVGDRGGVARAG